MTTVVKDKCWKDLMCVSEVWLGLLKWFPKGYKKKRERSSKVFEWQFLLHEQLNRVYEWFADHLDFPS